MNSVKITVNNEIGWETVSLYNQNTPEFPAPGIKDSTHMARLQWQENWAIEKGDSPYWVNVKNPNESYDIRQIWVLSPDGEGEKKEQRPAIIQSLLKHEIPLKSKQTGISEDWLAVWAEVEMFYGDPQKKETREQLLLRLQTYYSLTLNP